MNTAEPIRILLLEDSESDAFLIRTALRNSEGKFDVTQVETLREARAALENAHELDVLIGDLNLPDSSHDNTLAFLFETQHELPVIILDSCDDPVLAEKCEQGAAVCYSKQKLLDKAFLALIREQASHAMH